jgi:hypothetical protein
VWRGQWLKNQWRMGFALAFTGGAARAAVLDGRLLSTITERGVALLFYDVDYFLDTAGLADGSLLRCGRCCSPLILEHSASAVTNTQRYAAIPGVHGDWICDQVRLDLEC